MQAHAHLVSGPTVDLNITEFHKFGDVSSSEKVFAYQYLNDYDTNVVVKLYFDVPIRITQDVVSEIYLEPLCKVL